MKNTVRELTEVLVLIENAKRLQEEANNAAIACFNYLEMHTELPLYKYGTDLSVYINLFEAIKGFIAGDHKAASQLEIITKDIEDAMDIKDEE